MSQNIHPNRGGFLRALPSDWLAKWRQLGDCGEGSASEVREKFTPVRLPTSC